MAMAAAPLAMMPPEVEEAHAAQVTRVIGALADKAGIARKRCHIHMGEVADELSTCVRRSGTAVVVMGAVSRSALARLFIGNTAERALDHVTCDVLIVKPRGFRSGVESRPRPVARRPRAVRARSRRKPGSTAVAMQPLPTPPFL
jgi:nucleotide-binding universal stress UspA family protein